MAAYQEKQLKHMKGDHVWNRKSETTNRRSELTADTTTANQNTLNLNFEDDEMPFATAKTVKHIKKKSLITAGENMLSPQSFIRRESLQEPTADDLTLANRTSVSNRMRQLDFAIEE